MKLVSVVIPVVEYHDEYLPDLFKNLLPDIEVIQEIIIGRSGLKRNENENYLNWLKKIASDASLTCSITLSPVANKAREGPNRNRCWGLVNTKYTAFIDADDIYSLGRLTLLKNIADETGAALLLHDYSLEIEGLVDARDVLLKELKPLLISGDDLRQATFGSTAYPTPKQAFESKDSTSLRMPEEVGHLGVHHAHSFVLTSLREDVMFRDIFPGSDGLFCQEVLAQKAGVYVIPLKMSAWLNKRSAYAKSQTVFSRLIFRIKALVKGVFNL